MAEEEHVDTCFPTWLVFVLLLALFISILVIFILMLCMYKLKKISISNGPTDNQNNQMTGSGSSSTPLSGRGSTETKGTTTEPSEVAPTPNCVSHARTTAKTPETSKYEKTQTKPTSIHDQSKTTAPSVSMSMEMTRNLRDPLGLSTIDRTNTTVQQQQSSKLATSTDMTKDSLKRTNRTK